MTDAVAVKTDLLRQMRALMEAELDALDRSVAAAVEGATHADAKAENKYDTRGLEASYLAGAQKERAGELAAAIQVVARMVPRAFAEDEAIGPGSLVELCQGDVNSWCFIVGVGAGYVMRWNEVSVVAITPQSPMGSTLLGKEVDDEISFRSGQGLKAYTVVTLL